MTAGAARVGSSRVTTAPASRAGGDACPGVFRPFPAGDGGIVRVRVPGGRLPVAALRDLGRIAGDFGAPFLQLTSRANLQVRGLPTPLPDAAVARLVAAAPIPSPAHERARNVLAAPFADRAVRVARDLDAALCARPELAALPGRFLFAVDGDPASGIAGEGADVLLRPGDRDDLVAVRLPGPAPRYAGRRVAPGAGVAAALDLAQRFLAVREGARTWRTVDLPTGSPLFAELAPVDLTDAAPPEPGRHGEHLMIGVPLGLLGPDQIEAIAGAAHLLGAAQVGLTPWKAVVLSAGDGSAATDAERLLGAAGLTTAPSAAHLVTACIGAPWCRRTQVRTVDLARTLAVTEPDLRGPVHLSGCERRCGAPQQEHVELFPAPGTTAAQLRDELEAR